MSNSKALLACFLPALWLAARQPPHGPANPAKDSAATFKESGVLLQIAKAQETATNPDPRVAGSPLRTATGNERATDTHLSSEQFLVALRAANANEAAPQTPVPKRKRRASPASSTEQPPKRPPTTASVSFTRSADTIHVLINNEPFTDFLFKEADNKPYLHPLRSASGKVVSRHYPMETVPGEDTEHPHHRGIAFTHGDVNGYNFWASEPEQKDAHQGRILLDKIIRTQDGRDSGILEADFRWVNPEGGVILREHRVMTFYAHPTLRIIDFDIQLTAAQSPVRFGDTKEGSFYVRLGRELSEDTGGTMINSNGAKSEKNVWGHQADWVDDYGTVQGEQLGVAIFDHPANPRHPTYWHSRAYGLLAVNIFGLHDFLNDKTKDGSLTLKPSDTLRFRYRVLVHPGDTATAHIARLYDEYCRKAGDKQ